MTTILYLLAAYLVGSIPFGLLAGFTRGVDIRTMGSGNIGATNVLRCLGKPLGLTVFVLDFLKGLVPVAAAASTHPAATGEPGTGSWMVAGVAVAAIFGHNFPVWLRFRGGKGVATSAGVLLGFLPWPLLLGVLAWAGLFFTTRYVAVASIGSGVAIPVGVLIEGAIHGQFNPAALAFALFAALMVIWRHRTNLQRLRAGTEHRFQRRQAQPGSEVPTSSTSADDHLDPAGTSNPANPANPDHDPKSPDA